MNAHPSWGDTPGVPLQPHISRFHWLVYLPFSDDQFVPIEWNALDRQWVRPDSTCDMGDLGTDWAYHGPCVPPDVTRSLMATVEHLRNQLVVASDYAASENDSRVPSTWQIQNAHLDAYLGQIERLLEDAAQ